MKVLIPSIWAEDKVEGSRETDEAEAAIRDAYRKVSKLSKSREVSLVLTKLEEAQHWLAADQTESLTSEQ